jgi:hypothetical protein
MGAGPSPVFWVVNHPGVDGIHFDVVPYFVELCGASHPMIEGFVLPKGHAGSIKNLIRQAGARALDGSRDFAQRLAREDQDVNVVQHDDPGVEVAESPLVGCNEESFDYGVGYFWIPQPRGAGGAV